MCLNPHPSLIRKSLRTADLKVNLCGCFCPCFHPWMSSLSLHGTDLVVFSLGTYSRYLLQQQSESVSGPDKLWYFWHASFYSCGSQLGKRSCCIFCIFPFPHRKPLRGILAKIYPFLAWYLKSALFFLPILFSFPRLHLGIFFSGSILLERLSSHSMRN